VHADLEAMKKRGLPTREAMVTMINGHLQTLLTDVIAKTPNAYPKSEFPSGHAESSHLRDSWGIVPAT